MGCQTVCALRKQNWASADSVDPHEQGHCPAQTWCANDAASGYAPHWLEDLGRIAYMDSFNTSPVLLFELQSRAIIGACRTTNVNRKHMPMTLKPAEGDDPVFAHESQQHRYGSMA